MYLNSDKIQQLSREVGRDNLPVIVAIFFQELTEYQAEIESNGESLEQRLGQISHALKSSAASFGADNLCKVAIDIDARVKAGMAVNTPETRHDILSSLEQTSLAYASLIE